METHLFISSISYHMKVSQMHEAGKDFWLFTVDQIYPDDFHAFCKLLVVFRGDLQVK